MAIPQAGVPCGKKDLESHTIFPYFVSSLQLWSKTFWKFGLSWGFRKYCTCKEATLQLFVGSPFKKEALVIWQDVVSPTLWRIWSERNQRVFKVKNVF